MKIRPILILGLIGVISLSGCDKPAAQISPPLVPQEVINVWKMTPPPNGKPPSVSRQLTLPKFSSYSGQEVLGDMGYFQEGQWIDIVVKSTGLPAYFFEQQAGSIGIGLEVGGTILGLPAIGSLASGGKDFAEAGGSPTAGKFLYLPLGYQVTQTGSQNIYTTAFRLLLPKDGNCQIAFTNYNPTVIGQVAFEVYPLARTSGWADEAFENSMDSWIRSIPESERAAALSSWMAQFK